MKICKILLILPFLFLSGNTPKDPVYILCVGDSITQGGKNNKEEFTYRLPLQMLLHEKQISFDFIGSRNKGLHADAIWPNISEGVPFDPHHEGYYGNKTADVCRKAMESSSEWEKMPNIVLVHLGTNDQKADNYEKAVGAPLRQFITFMRNENPQVIILLGHLNFNHGTPAQEIRNVVEKVATDMDTKESPVKTVPHYKNWRENPDHKYTDTFDWAHPNLKGQEKMAIHWFNAMQPYLK